MEAAYQDEASCRIQLGGFHLLPPLALGRRSSIDELQYKLHCMQRKVSVKQELNVLRQGLVTVCWGVEVGTSYIPSEPVKLAGFSQAVSNNINEFDSILKQVALQFGGSFDIPLEAQLLLALAKVGAQVHMTNVVKDAMGRAAAPTPTPVQTEQPSTVQESTSFSGPELS